MSCDEKKSQAFLQHSIKCVNFLLYSAVARLPLEVLFWTLHCNKSVDELKAGYRSIANDKRS